MEHTLQDLRSPFKIADCPFPKQLIFRFSQSAITLALHQLRSQKELYPLRKNVEGKS